MTKERAEEMAERARRFGYRAEALFDPDEGGWYVKIADIVLTPDTGASVSLRQDAVEGKT